MVMHTHLKMYTEIAITLSEGQREEPLGRVKDCLNYQLCSSLSFPTNEKLIA